MITRVFELLGPPLCPIRRTDGELAPCGLKLHAHTEQGNGAPVRHSSVHTNTSEPYPLIEGSPRIYIRVVSYYHKPRCILFSSSTNPERSATLTPEVPRHQETPMPHYISRNPIIWNPRSPETSINSRVPQTSFTDRRYFEQDRNIPVFK